MQIDNPELSKPQRVAPLIEALFHDSSDSVRFQVDVSGRAVDASITRQALRHRFAAGDAPADLLSSYRTHHVPIHAMVMRRLSEGALAPVMLREAHFLLP